jgi:hypothetical protein
MAVAAPSVASSSSGETIRLSNGIAASAKRREKVTSAT